ncbi:CoA-binding protein [Zobellella sp. An-6]|uniref:CoA-binding protein n=1 Tax=Zobellella endophytica TaxID=2116700 RepID=A0A2P7QWV0_9GAMM|nr:CoA-binding protein [Zobellella endophytica]
MDALEQDRLKRILSNTRSIALVGASNRPDRASYQVMEYLLQHGYQVYPVNPQLAGAVILGQTCVAGLEDLDQPVQLVNVFRRGEFAADIALEAIEHETLCLWLQEGITSEQAAESAAEAELEYVEDRCIKVVHQQLLG